MNNIIEQAKFCEELQKRLTNAVVLHEEYKEKTKKEHHGYVSEWRSGIAENGAAKTQIMSDIVRLRRELNVLSRMFDDWRNDEWIRK